MKYPELYGYRLDQLKPGMRAVMSRTITDTDVRNFAGVSGDTNPMHLNEDFARETQFNGTIVHGFLTASLISAVIGTRLPGPGCIYLGQSLKFTAPVYIGDTVYAVVEVAAIDAEKRRVTLKATAEVGGKTVIAGEAMVLVPDYNA